VGLTKNEFTDEKTASRNCCRGKRSDWLQADNTATILLKQTYY
jgi:hypothetical protein